jgi:glycine dehydrogenase subunit 1
MPYIPNTADDQRAMLDTIGAGSIEELFSAIPAELRLNRELCLLPALGELDLTSHMVQLAGQNLSAACVPCFLGAGSYDHFVPAAVDAIASRSEFYTSYTPYQAEAGQGNLQALFEYQTLITQLTGMDVSNSSLYDGGTGAAEAALMALDITRRTGRIVVAGTLHPEYREIIKTYLANFPTEVVTLDAREGAVSRAELQSAVNGDTACVLLQQPNFFGCLEDVEACAAIAHQAGALFIVAFDPVSLGLLRRPGDYGADICVAEGQSLGNPMAYGGPYLGIIACRERFMRRMPGRLVGQTADRRGRPCWVLTLQTREQHIRREKATSNICTNQALFALRAAVYLALMGPQGMHSAAELCLQKANYALNQLTAGGKLSRVFNRPIFKEFVVRMKDGRVDDLLEACRREYILAGVPLGRWFPELDDCLLVAVTEKRTKEEIDRLVKLMS